MKHIIALLATVALITFYVVEYKEATEIPCVWDAKAQYIRCLEDGLVSKGRHLICADKPCVEEILQKNGTQHLVGVWEVSFLDGLEIVTPNAKKLNVIQKYELE